MRNPGMVIVHTMPCIMCGKDGMVEMPEEAYRRWSAEGAFIQVAWPEGPAGLREQLINGTHPECFDSIDWGDEE